MKSSAAAPAGRPPLAGANTMPAGLGTGQSTVPGTTKPPKPPSRVQTALDGAASLAGGLISQPSETTKHMSIVRHSSPLVWYRGPETCLAVTVLADAPLPPGRSFWLQRKGFSGSAGMNLKVLAGSTTTWIDVTPVARAALADVPAADEADWQRDLVKFDHKFQKADPRVAATHKPRETAVVRIPAAAADGYFRLVLCSGGGGAGRTRLQVLCPSPVFRIASLSMDSSVLRGAGLASMPLEVGLKVASFMAVKRYAGPVKAIATGSRFLPRSGPKAFVAKKAGEMIFGGPQDANGKGQVRTMPVSAARPQQATYYDGAQSEARRARGHRAAYDDDVLQGDDVFAAPPEVVGPDAGPLPPYPLQLSARVAKGNGLTRAEQLGFPTVVLADASPPAAKTQLHNDGVYFGWLSVAHQDQPLVSRASGGLARSASDKAGRSFFSSDDANYSSSAASRRRWREAIFSVGPLPGGKPTVVPEKVLAAHVVSNNYNDDNDNDELDDLASYAGSRATALVMGYLRPALRPEVTAEEAVETVARDIAVAVASLSRERWDAQPASELANELARAAKGDRGLAERIRQSAQRGIGSLPLHLAGVRSSAAADMDLAHGNGGYYVSRG